MFPFVKTGRPDGALCVSLWEIDLGRKPPQALFGHRSAVKTLEEKTELQHGTSTLNFNKEQVMINRCIFLGTGVCLLLSSAVHADGDPFYYSTWYSQPNTAMSWAGSSVTGNLSSQPESPLSGAMYPHSPRYFHPGYGYATHGWPYRSPLRYYHQFYSYGRLTYSVPIGYGSAQTSDEIRRDSFGTTGMGQIGGLAPVDGLHRPWYLPGSPANDTGFHYGW